MRLRSGYCSPNSAYGQKSVSAPSYWLLEEGPLAMGVRGNKDGRRLRKYTCLNGSEWLKEPVKGGRAWFSALHITYCYLLLLQILSWIPIQLFFPYVIQKRYFLKTEFHSQERGLTTRTITAVSQLGPAWSITRAVQCVKSGFFSVGTKAFVPQLWGWEMDICTDVTCM